MSDIRNTMAQLDLLQEIMGCSLLNSNNLESLMRSDIYADTLLFDIVFSEYLGQCNKTRKEVIHNKEEVDDHFLCSCLSS